MLFNSINFVLFLPVVFILYWFVSKRKPYFQNIILLAASYFFYANWDFRFLFLLLFSTLLDFYSGIKIESTTNSSSRLVWLWLSVGINLLFLGLFKYYDFFVNSFSDLLAGIGYKVHLKSIGLILPVGISFYTFHGLSYVIDIYNKRIKAERNIIDYSLFVSFFPLLVAGPIERATHLLPQLKRKRNFDSVMMVDGLRQILWGMFKKVVVADSCAEVANLIFENYSNYSGSTLVIGVIFFSIQIYGDFSGYSDIALGTAKLFGVDLLRNFNYPYFSRDIAEFWRRWHISLSSWFKDYVYIPLGGSKVGVLRSILNVIIIFVLSGFWHGANWTFIMWGAINATYFVPLMLLKKNRKNTNIVSQGKLLPSWRDLLSIVKTNILITFAWIFFRSQDLESAINYINDIFSITIFNIPEIRPFNLMIIVVMFFAVEWVSREKIHPLEKMETIVAPIRYSIYLLLFYFILFNHKFHQQTEFIYFQF